MSNSSPLNAIKLTFLVLFIITGALSFTFYFGYLVIGFSYFESLFLFFLLIITLLPIGKQRLGQLSDDEPLLSFGGWFSRLLVCQVTIALAWLLVTIPILQQSFAGQAEAAANVYLFSVVRSLLNQGLHPWPFIILMALTIGVIGGRYHLEKISSMLRFILPERMAHPTLLSMVDIIAMGGGILFFWVLVSFASFTLANAALSFLDLPQISLYQGGLCLTFFILAPVLSQRSVQQWMRHRTHRHNHVAGVLLYLLIFLVAITVIYQFVLSSLPAPQQKELLKPLIPFDYSEYILELWMMGFWAISVISAPLLAAYIARISKGRTVRQVVMSCLALPLCLAGFFQLVGRQHAVHDASLGPSMAEAIAGLFEILFTSPWSQVLTFSVVVFLLLFVFASRNLSDSMIAMTANFAGKKMKRLRQQLIVCQGICAWMLCIFILSGLYGLQYLLLMMAFLVFIVTIPAAIFGLSKVALKSQEKLAQIKPLQ